jgi:RNA ligase
MVLLSEILDTDALAEMVGEGYISCKPHPNAPLRIYDYTQRTQYEQKWTPETLASRGLIVHDDDRVWARPFPKFFNAAEHETLPVDELFEVYDKLDGSLGILYRHPLTSEWCISTRGSFVSEQAIHATELVRTRYAEVLDQLVQPSETWLFEIIYPSNRIVVDYQGLDDLVLLAIIDNQTANDKPLPAASRLDGWTGRVVTRHHTMREWEQMVTIDNETRNGEEAEGYVVRFESGLRVKVKFADYVRLHRIVTGLSTLTVWEHLSEKRSFDELLERVPDELYKWLTNYVAELEAQFHAIEDSARTVLSDERVQREDRKATALFFAEQQYRVVLFKMYDNKPYDNVIWRLLKPTFAKPFSTATVE